MAVFDKNTDNRRKYLRLESVFPVLFKIILPEGSDSRFQWFQGFTSNVSEGGICLEVNDIRAEVLELLKTRAPNLSLVIEIPVGGAPVHAQAKPAWFHEVKGKPSKVIIGLRYEAILPSHRDRILRIARMKAYFTPASIAVMCALGLLIVAHSAVNAKLTSRNRQLVRSLIAAMKDSGNARQDVTRIARDKDVIGLQLAVLREKLAQAQNEKTALAAQVVVPGDARLEEVKALIDRLAVEREELDRKLLALQHKEAVAVDGLKKQNQLAMELQRTNMEKMYGWLKVHQNARTGLVMSFEGDSDMDNVAFVYDQALALMAYSYYGDFDRVKKLADFFMSRAQAADGKFYNAYFANGGEPAEFIVHAGPNIWLGIALVQYFWQSQDASYMPLAEEIAGRMMKLQKEDPDGGLRGGPTVTWFATEHNLDAYAFFNMLHAVTKNDAYRDARDKVLGWLIKYSYASFDVPINRGKGDATIATDTYAWSIAALGARKLAQIGMDPDAIMQFAEERCSVVADFQRPEGGTVKVKGFDFAAPCNVSRGGIVSSEWTAQMVLSLRLMAAYHRAQNNAAKAKDYDSRADEYLGSLSSMVISSPSLTGQGRICLPYATMDYVDTGHGWRTPKGRTTGAVSGTVYTLFAYHVFNPLELREK